MQIIGPLIRAVEMESLVNVEYRYLDIIWLDNFIMNFILLWVTSKISRNQSQIWRLWLSASIGAFYSIALFIPGFGILGKIPIKMAISIIMLVLAYKFSSYKEFLKRIPIFYITTFVFGGAAFSLYYFFDDDIVFSEGVFYIKNYPIKMLILSALVVIILIRSIWVLLRSRISQEELLYNIRISFDNQGIDINALLDTGNELCDPISHSPVIVVELETLMPILPNDIKTLFIRSLEDDLEAVTKIISRSSWISRFRMIPFRTFGTSNGILIGFKPDNVKVLINKVWEETTDAVVGVYCSTLSNNGNYHALVSPDIIRR